MADGTGRSTFLCEESDHADSPEFPGIAIPARRKTRGERRIPQRRRDDPQRIARWHAQRSLRLGYLLDQSVGAKSPRILCWFDDAVTAKPFLDPCSRTKGVQTPVVACQVVPEYIASLVVYEER